MNRTDLVRDVARATGLLAADVDIALGGLQTVVAEALAAGEKVSLPGLFSVDSVRRPARTGRNPRTGEPLDIPARWAVKLTAGHAWRSAAGRRTG